jgi:hypothetical protein
MPLGNEAFLWAEQRRSSRMDLGSATINQRALGLFFKYDISYIWIVFYVQAKIFKPRRTVRFSFNADDLSKRSDRGGRTFVVVSASHRNKSLEIVLIEVYIAQFDALVLM